MFPVVEALMLSPGGNAVHLHFPFICCMSFNVYHHLQSHQALRAVISLLLDTSVMLGDQPTTSTLTWWESFFSSVTGVKTYIALEKEKEPGSTPAETAIPLLCQIFYKGLTP